MIATLIERLEKDAALTEEEKKDRRTKLFGCWAEIHKQLTFTEKKLAREKNCDISLYLDYLRLCYKIKLAYEGKTCDEAPWNEDVTELERFIKGIREEKINS